MRLNGLHVCMDARVEEKNVCRSHSWDKRTERSPVNLNMIKRLYKYQKVHCNEHGRMGSVNGTATFTTNLFSAASSVSFIIIPRTLRAYFRSPIKLHTCTCSVISVPPTIPWHFSHRENRFTSPFFILPPRLVVYSTDPVDLRKCFSSAIKTTPYFSTLRLNKGEKWFAPLITGAWAVSNGPFLGPGY